jgi:hypothetical protein
MFLEVLNPVAQLRGSLSARTISPRPSTLDGKSVALLASGRTNSDIVLGRVAENLQQRFPGTVTKSYIEHKQPWPAGLIEKIAAECDVAVIATAD